jgi:hypothetical protein
MATNPVNSMPARGECTAPTFNPDKPRELVRFFDELEFQLDKNGVTDEAEKKKQALRYVDFEIEQIWKAIKEYKDQLATYNDFKKAVLAHYPDASGDYVYSLRDLDHLIGE